MLRGFALFLSMPFVLGTALAHPGHGAMEIHWHLDDIVWAAIGALALVGIGLLVRKVLKR